MVGYYDLTGSSIALGCPNGCQSCSSSVLCSTCLSGYYLVFNLCASSCPERYFPSTQTKLCQSCPYDCLTCHNSSYCSSCSLSDNRILNANRCVPLDGYYDNQGVIAVACPLGCKMCSSGVVCSACLSGWFLVVGGLCYQHCPVRYIKNIGSFVC
jgi:hypothetical protein